MIEVIWNDVKVELDVIEEFENDEPPMFRFTVLQLQEPSPRAICTEYSEFEPVEDGSYCTNIPEGTSSYDLTRLAAVIMSGVYNQVQSNVSIKKRCEELSWIDPSWLTKKEA